MGRTYSKLADVERIKALEAKNKELRDALSWLINLGHAIGKAGGDPEEGELESALEFAVGVVSDDDNS